MKAPRVNDERVDEATGERERFFSAIVPPWCRKSPKISEVLPLLYLHGLSSGYFVPALEQLLGSAAGLSPATVPRLTARRHRLRRGLRRMDENVHRSAALLCTAIVERLTFDAGIIGIRRRLLPPRPDQAEQAATV